MYDDRTAAWVKSLVDSGLNFSQVARATGVSRAAIRAWITVGRTARPECPVLSPEELAHEQYSYLLGLYLGDGCISVNYKGVGLLRIACADSYPVLMELCAAAVADVLPQSKVGRVQAIGCANVTSYSKHWACLFPQHGPGRKHERKIELAKLATRNSQ